MTPEQRIGKLENEIKSLNVSLNNIIETQVLQLELLIGIREHLGLQAKQKV